MSGSDPHLVLEGMDAPRSGPAKAVTIAAEPESMSPLLRPALSSQESGNNTASQAPKQYRVSGGRRLIGRPSHQRSLSSLHNLSNVLVNGETENSDSKEVSTDQSSQHRGHGRHIPSAQFVSQVLDWLQEERRKHSGKRGSKTSTRRHTDRSTISNQVNDGESDMSANQLNRYPSNSSDGSLALDRLEQILVDNMIIDPDRVRRTPSKEYRGFNIPRRTSSVRKLRKGSIVPSSDTDFLEGDALVPSTDVVLDNSKTMSYSDGGVDTGTGSISSRKRAAKEKEAWHAFKSEIVRLAHTLRLKGWRRVSLDHGGDIEVERLSGALTNAVYVVVPPKNLPQPPADGNSSSTSISMASKKSPQKLLLRIYGPQVEHLIDRESELQILRRLARKKIGPRLLGTFTNGRFEEFFNARTLTAADLRNPETSRNIAKRMRELHDGIELLEQERDDGPFLWRNWDKWVTKCEEVMTWVDQQILSGEAGPCKGRAGQWRRRGLVCGVEWPFFRKTVDEYRRWLDDQYGGSAALREHLVFAHNDTQYGNLLRLEPSGESPLLLPANEHKQLVVIDFEYASANTRGLEFANHFTEWCYNYHDSQKAYSCNTAAYPTPAEQYRFLKSYVQHRPQFSFSSSTSFSTATTPTVEPSPGPSSSISAFMLDSRAPPAVSYAEEEKKREEQVEKEIQRLMHETRLWRVANSAQWVAWGVVQAKVEGLEDALGRKRKNDDDEKTPTQSPGTKIESDPISAEAEHHDKRPEGLVAEALSDGKEMAHEDDDEEEFDYLGYAQERAMFFWGDCLGMGIVREEDLPKGILEKVKRVDY